MIIEQHYDDEVLIGLIDEAEEDSHLPACDTCAGTLESYRDLSSALHDGVVWDEREVSEAPSPKTTSFLRDFAARTKAEDVAARPIVAKLVADPALIDQHPEWRTAGVVRGLLAHVDTIRFSDPQATLALTRTAVTISESVDSMRYSSVELARVRAFAWHELGYALYSADRYGESLQAYDRADDLLNEAKLGEFEAANVGLHRAQVYADLERIDEALEIVRSVRAIFRLYGAAKREAAADATEATFLFRVRRYAEALPVFQKIAADLAADDVSRALAYHNAADCLGQLSRFAEAKQACAKALAEFDRLRLMSMRARSRWVLGRILLAERSFEQSLTVLSVARNEFQELELHHEMAKISVDSAEAMWMLGRTEDLVHHCQTAMDYFAKAGLAYTQGALTALAYLKDAAGSRTLTKKGVAQVRDFFEILPKQPHLLFAFPL